MKIKRMKKFLPVFICLLVLCLFGCRTAETKTKSAGDDNYRLYGPRTDGTAGYYD